MENQGNQEIRVLRLEETLDGLHFIWEMYAQYTAPKCTKEQVERFQSTIKYEVIIPKVHQRELFFFGYFVDNSLVGVSAVNHMGQIVWVYSDQAYASLAVAQKLVEHMKVYCIQVLKTLSLKVEATQSSVEFYQLAGFCQTAQERYLDDMPLFPMECLLKAQGQGMYETSDKSNKGLWIGLIVAVVVGLVVVTALLSVGIFRNAGVKHSEFNREETWPYQGGEIEEPQREEQQGEEPQGIEAIESYEGENLTYTVEEKMYEEAKGEGKYTIDFSVAYPELSNLDSEKAVEINQILKACAMQTVNGLYLSPTDEMKDALLTETSPYLISYVTYKITYMDDDFMSVVFEDRYCQGNTMKEFIDLRSKNINLHTGEVYAVKDIVNLSDDYMKDWLVRMQGEAPQETVLKEVTTEEFKNILSGEYVGEDYYSTFFVKKEGMEIGLSYHHLNPKKTAYLAGWITAPYKMDEIKEYQTGSKFWSLIF